MMTNADQQPILRAFPRELPRQQDLEDFGLEASPAYQAIQATFGTSLRLRELKGIVNVVRIWWKVKDRTYLPELSRNQQRSVLLLVKYIDNHYHKIVPLFRHMALLDKERQAIPFLDNWA
jgi:hypothetical protein